MNETRLLELIRNRSQVYDLETGGFDPKVSHLLEGGIQDLRTGNLERTAFAPYFRDPVAETWQHLRGTDFTDRLEPWPRRMLETGPWQGLAQERQAHPGAWLRQHWVEPLSQGKWLWAHNAKFDLKFIAANLEAQDYSRAADALGDELGYKTRGRKSFHITAGRDTYGYTQAAYDNPATAAKSFVSSYGKFLSHMETAAANPRQGLVLDSQYLMQAALAHAQESGLITRTNDVFTGTSVEAWRHAFPESAREVAGEAHTVAADIGGTGRLIEDYLTLTGDIRSRATLSDTQKKALLFHQELQTHKTPLFQEATRKSFLKARYDLERQKKYELHNPGGEQVYSKDFKDILGVYEDLQKGRGYSLDLEGLHGSIAALSHGEVAEALAQGSQVSDDLMRQARISAESLFHAGQFKDYAWDLKMPGQVKQFVSRAWNWSRNSPGMMIAGGLAAVMTGLAVIPGKDDHYNTIEGLEHGWFGKQRRSNTDFGSGYQNSDRSRSVVEKDLDAYEAVKHEVHEHWGRYIMGAAVAGTAVAFAVNRTGAARFFKDLPGEIWKDIKGNRLVFGAGAGLGFYHEEQREETLTPAKWASIELAGLVDDVVINVMGAAATKWNLGWEASPGFQKVKNVVKAAGAGGIGYSVGRAAAAGHKMLRRAQQQRRQNNQKTTGLVQHLDRQKIHHTRMNGY